MSDNTRVYVGTVGQSVWRSLDGGLTFGRASNGVMSESHVRALTVHPTDPATLYLGIETGVYRSTNGADSWQPLPGPYDGRRVWSIAIDPHDPTTILVGTSPTGLFRSRDGGETWQELPAHMPAECFGGAPLTPRVTCITFDPGRPGHIYAGIEIDGVRYSQDGGDTWNLYREGLSSQDIHGLVVIPTAPRTLIATTNNDVNRSTDDGRTWQPLGVANVFPWRYARAAALDPEDPNMVWVGAGNGPPGNQGGLYRTRDRGETWEEMPLPVRPNSTIWNLGFHVADPSRIYATAINGYVYRTLDRGATWEKLPHEFGEVRGVAWTPVL